MNLLEGNIKKQLIILMLPLILGNILQQFYNTIDSMIAGHFIGDLAFGAIGVAGSVMNLFIFMLNGACVGVSVVFAQVYGLRKWDLLKKESFMSLLFGELFTITLSFISLLFLKSILNIIETPSDIFTYAFDYLKIILMGLPITFLYNWCSCALQASGDTKMPLYTLMIAMAINTILDYFFVAKLSIGTSGAALATVIAQFIASFICLLVMRKRHKEFFFSLSDCRLDKLLLKKTIRYGVVSALHQSSLYIGKLLVQKCVNTGGSDMIAAYSATMRIEGFANSFSDSGGAVLSTFVAQNSAVNNKTRVKEGLKQALQIMLSLSFLLAIIMIISCRSVVYILMTNPNANILDNVYQYIFVISLCYFLCFIGSTFVGYFRGLGKVEVPIIGTVIQITIRVIFSYILIDYMGLKAVSLATGIGWFVIVVYQIITYIKK